VAFRGEAAFRPEAACQAEAAFRAEGAFRVEAAFWSEVPLGLLEACWFLCTYSVSAESVLSHFGMEGSRPYDFSKPLPGVFVLHPSSFYGHET